MGNKMPQYLWLVPGLYAMPEKKTSQKPNLRLKEARMRQGWTQKDVADRINVPDTRMVGRWERGSHFPRGHYRQALSSVFGMSLEALGLIQCEPVTETVDAPSIPEPVLTSPATWILPPPFTPCIGREQEISELATLLQREDVRLVTLLGVGGVGKTRLVVQLAYEMRSRFPDGGCFVSLAAARDPAFVIPAIARTLGIQENSERSSGELIKGYLRKRRFLLVLDNFEQVRSAVSFIEEILCECPQVKILVTSRVVLHTPARHEFQVKPLALPKLKQTDEPETLMQYAAIKLFVFRVQAVDRRFHLTAKNARQVAEICIHLEGLPLAIELAAARVKHLTLPQLFSKLSSRLRILKNVNSSDNDDRQSTLSNTIKWSYDLLPEREKWMFRRLSLFNGNCSLEAIEAICGDQPADMDSILDSVTALIDQSLLQRIDDNGEGEEARYVMLEMLREYGQELLHKGDEYALCRRYHALYFLALVEQAAPSLKGAQQVRWMVRLDHNLENLRSALQWFIEREETDFALRFIEAFGKFCGLRGYWSEEWSWFEIVLKLPTTGPTLMRARVLRRAGHLAYRLRKLHMSCTLLKKSVALSRQLNDYTNLAGSLVTLGRAMYRLGDVTAAAELLSESVQAARQSNDRWSLANALEAHGKILSLQGKIEEARQVLEESLLLARQTADKESLTRILTTLVSIELELPGRLEQAGELAEECLSLARELGTRPLIALVLDRLAKVTLFRGEYEQAISLIDQHIELASELGDTPTVFLKQLYLGEIALHAGNVVLAKQYARESLTFFRGLDDSPNIAFSLNLLGQVLRLEGDFLQAIQAYAEALHIEKEIGNKKYFGKHLAGITNVMASSRSLELSALLSGYVELLQPEVVMHPAQLAEYHRNLQETTRQLGAETFASMKARGQSMSEAQVLELVASEVGRGQRR